MIFLHFSFAAILFPLQHNMAGPHFSVRALCLPFCKIANGLCTCTFFAYFLWVRTLLFITSWGPRMFYKEDTGEGNRRGARQLFVGVLCFCCLLIWFFSWCRLFQRIWAGAKRGLVSFLFCVSPENWKALSWSVVRPENKSKWHVTRTQCLDGPAKVSGPICCGRFLFCRLSATSGERGQGARAALRWWRLPGEAVGMAGRARSASRSLRHTVGQPLHKRRLSITHQVSDASSLSHGVHAFSAGQVSACNERFDSWRATEAEVMELLQIWSWLMLMGKL